MLIGRLTPRQQRNLTHGSKALTQSSNHLAYAVKLLTLCPFIDKNANRQRDSLDADLGKLYSHGQDVQAAETQHLHV